MFGRLAWWLSDYFASDGLGGRRDVIDYSHAYRS